MTKEREAEIRKHHAPHNPHCNEHCTTRGLLELLDAERKKNAKLERCAKQAPILCDFHRHTTEIEQLRKERDALRDALREVSETRIFVSSKDAANRAIDIADAALAAQGDKPRD